MRYTDINLYNRDHGISTTTLTGFKAGDLVRCKTYRLHRLKANKVYTVLSVCGPFVRVMGDDGIVGYMERHFEPVPAPTPFHPDALKPVAAEVDTLAKVAKLTPQAIKLGKLLAGGAAVSPRSALIDLKIGALARRIADLRESGMDVKLGKRVSSVSGDKYSVYYMSKAEQRRVKSLMGW